MGVKSCDPFVSPELGTLSQSYNMPLFTVLQAVGTNMSCNTNEL